MTTRIRQLILSALLALTFGFTATVNAADLMTLQFNFANNDWRELLTPLWGGLPEVVKEGENTFLEFGPGSFYGSPRISCPPGSTIAIEFDASTTAIEANGDAWRTAAVQLGLFEREQEVNHFDLLNTGAPTGLRHYESRTPVKNDGFRLCFGNYGKSGKFRIANLKITVEVPGRNVERDGSFDGMFGINDWFVQKGGSDWDDVGLGQFKNARVIENAFPAPGRTLELDGEATVISQLFPYNGESLIIGAWYKQEKIVRGEQTKPWANAGIQLVYLDADDNVIGHNDVTPSLVPGTLPWNYQLFTVPAGSLSPKVKSFAVYLRIFGGATGKAFFDEIGVIMQGEGQARNYNSTSGTLQIGGKDQATELKRVWSGVDLSYCSQTSLPQVMTALRQLKEEAGLEYVRTREFFNGPFLVKSVADDGTMTFDFTEVDRYVDPMVLELELSLVPTIETVPPHLQTGKRGHVPSNFEQWGVAVKALVNHWIDRYGAERVSKWIFECWNEPGSDFFQGSDEEFCKLFVTYLRTLTEIEKERGIKLHIGTPSGAMNNLLSVAMAEAEKAGLASAVTDGSTHIYGGFAGSLELYRLGVEDINKRLAPFTGDRKLPIHVTEFNGSAMVSHHFDTQTGAAFVVKANRLMADNGVERSYFYCVIDHPYLNLEKHFTADLGYMTHYDAVPKPSFNAVALLNTLRGKRLPVKASSEPYDAYAAIDDDGTIRVVVTTFSEEELGEFKPTAVTLEIDWNGRPERIETAQISRVDSHHANSYTAFEQAGKPLYKEHPDTTAFRNAARRETGALVNYRFENGKLIVPLTMELNSVAAITVR